MNDLKAYGFTITPELRAMIKGLKWDSVAWIKGEDGMKKVAYVEVDKRTKIKIEQR